MSLSDYKVIKELGSGAFGVVILAEKGGQRFCVKKVDVRRMPKKDRDAAVAEAKVLQKFHHPNIVRYENFFIDQKIGSLCIVMELAGANAPWPGVTDPHFAYRLLLVARLLAFHREWRPSRALETAER